MMTFLTRRTALLVAATCAATLGLAAIAEAQTSIKIGYAISRTGPNTGGAAVTTIPNYELWVKEVNAAGGIKLGDKRVPIEVVQYDDRSNAEEAVRALERLINQDKVDFILPPWGTGLNLAVGPTLNREGYPHLAATAVTDRAPELAKRWPNSFWMLGTSADAAKTLVELLSKLRDEKKIGDTVAMVSIADGFGIDLSSAARPALTNAKFKLAYDKSYPIGTQDLAPDRQRGEGAQSGCLHRLQLSAGYAGADRAIAHRRLQSEDLLHRRRHRFPALSRRSSARTPKA